MSLSSISISSSLRDANKVIVFADGSTIGYGATFVTPTNVATSKSIDLNISGPGRFSVTDNTVTNLGPTFGFDLPANVLPSSLPTVFFAHGQIVTQFDNLGNVVAVSFTGTPQNVCESLQ